MRRDENIIPQWVIEMDKELRKRNMELMKHHLTKAKEAFKRYKKHGGNESFHITTTTWGSCGDVDDYLEFDSIVDEGINDINYEIKEEDK